MPLNPTASQSLLSAFDFVGGPALTGTRDGQSASDLGPAESPGDSFEEMLRRALDGTTPALPYGVIPDSPTVSRTAPIPSDATLFGTVDQTSEPTSDIDPEAGAPARAGVFHLSSAHSTDDEPLLFAATPTLDSVRNQSSTETAQGGDLAAAIKESGAARTASTTNIEAHGLDAEAVSSDGSAAAIDETPHSATNLPSSALAQSDDAANPVILKFTPGAHRSSRWIATRKPVAPEPQPVGQRDSTSESAALPASSPLDSVAGGDSDGTSAEILRFPSPVAQNPATIAEQTPADVSTGLTAATGFGDDATTESASDEASAQVQPTVDQAASAAERAADAILSGSEASAAGIAVPVSALQITTSTGRDSSSDGPPGDASASEHRTIGARTREAVEAGPDATAIGDTTVEAPAAGVTGVRAVRSRPDVGTTSRHASDDGSLLDVSSATTSQPTAVSDAATAPDSTTSEPSVAQQVSQAVETWRDSLQETGTARFAAWLSPPDLGHIWVELTRSADGITARLKGSDDSVQSLLESQEPELRQALNDSGIAVTELDLSGRATGDFSSDQQHQPPEQPHLNEYMPPRMPAPAASTNSTRHDRAIDVRA